MHLDLLFLLIYWCAKNFSDTWENSAFWFANKKKLL